MNLTSEKTPWTGTARILVTALVLIISGCQTSQVRDNANMARTADEVAVPEAEAEAERIEDPDLIYALIAAELSRQEEDYEAATDYYLDASLLSRDIEIFRQAVRLAAYTGQFDKVAIIVERWREIAPDDLEATQFAISIALKTNDLEKIELELGRVIMGAGADEVSAWKNSAQLLANMGNPKKAKEILSNLVEKYGQETSVAARLAQSQLLRHFGSNMDAMEVASATVSDSPEAIDAWLWRAQLNLELGQKQAAVLDLQSAYELKPQDSVLGFKLANILQELGEYGRARKVLQGLSDDPASLFALGAFALQSENQADAEAAYAALIDYSAQDNDGYFFAGQLAELLQQDEQALSWYQRTEAGAFFLRAGMRRAWLSNRLISFEAAKRILDELKVAESANQENLFMLEAEMLVGRSQRNDALEVYSRGLALMPSSSNLRYARALLAESLDDLDLAVSDLRSVIEDNPQDASALNALGYTLADRTDRLKEAREYIEKALAIEPDAPAIIDSMGWVLFRMGEFEESIRFLKTALELQHDGEVAAHLVEVLWTHGWKDEAKKVWESALEVEPGSAVLLETIERLTQ